MIRMRSRTWIAAALACSFTLMADSAMAARGIILNKPSAPNPNGKIIVSEGGGTGFPVPLVEPGDAISFIESLDADVGSLVQFDIEVDPNGEPIASRLALEQTGTVYSSLYLGNIFVGASEVALVTDANIDGKITVNGGTLAVVGNSRVGGKIETSINGSKILISSGTTVEGKVEVSGASAVSIRNSIIDGKVTTNSSTFVTIRGCTIDGKLDLINNTRCSTSENTVGGQTNTPGCTP